MRKTPSAAGILNFWFVETTPEFWFKKDDDFDAVIQDRFGKAVTEALCGRPYQVGPLQNFALLDS